MGRQLLWFFAIFCGFVVLWAEREAVLQFVVWDVAKAEQHFGTASEYVHIGYLPVEIQPNLMILRSFNQVDVGRIHEGAKVIGFTRLNYPWIGAGWLSLVGFSNRVVKIRRQLSAWRHILDADDPVSIESRGLSIIFYRKSDHVFVAVKIRGCRLVLIGTSGAIQDNIFVVNAHISPETAPFGIGSGISLLSAVNRSAHSGDHDYRGKHGVSYYALACTYGPTVAFAFVLCGIFACGIKISFKGLEGTSRPIQSD